MDIEVILAIGLVLFLLYRLVAMENEYEELKRQRRIDRWS